MFYFLKLYQIGSNLSPMFPTIILEINQFNQHTLTLYDKKMVSLAFGLWVQKHQYKKKSLKVRKGIN